MAFEINLDTSKAHGKIKGLNSSLDKVSAKLKIINSQGLSFSKVGAQAKALRTNADLGALGLQNLTRSVSQLKAQTSTVNQGITHLNDRFSNFDKSTKKASNGLKDVKKSMNQTSKQAAVLRSGMYATGTHFGAFTARTILAATAAYAFIRSIVAMITVGAEFEVSMARAKAVMGNFGQGEAAARAKLLENEVRRLGKSTIFTVTEVADGLVFLGMAGLTTAEASKALAPVLSIASIGMLDMAKAADIATNVMLGFDRKAADLVEIVDIMSVAITSSNMDMQQLGNALSYVAPVAESTNNSLKDTVAILELFHNVGIKSSRAGTSLRRAMINLSKPTEKVGRVLTKLGVTLFDQQNKMKPLVNIMRQFVKAQASVSDITTIFGARAAPALLKFYSDLQKEVNGGTSSFQRMRDELEANEGVAAKIQKGIEDTLSADWKLLVSALSELSLQIFTKLVPQIRSAVTGVTEFVKSLNGPAVLAFVATIAELVVIKYALIPAISLVMAGLKGFTISAITAAAAARTLSVAVSIMSGPLGWIALAIGVAAYTLSVTKNKIATVDVTSALKLEARALLNVEKIRRNLMVLDELAIKKKATVDTARLAEVERAKKGLTDRVVSLQNKLTKAETNSTKEIEATTPKQSIDQLKSRRAAGILTGIISEKLGQEQMVLANLELETIELKKSLELSKEILNIKKDERKVNDDAVKKIQERARLTKNLDADTIVSERRLKTEKELARISKEEILRSINSTEASAQRITEYKNALSDVNSELDKLISAETTRLNTLDAQSSAVGLSIDDAKRLNKEFTKQRLLVDDLKNTKNNFGIRSGKSITREEAKALNEGDRVSESLKSVFQIESESYAIRLAALKEYHKQKGIVGAQAALELGDLSLRSGAAQVASAAGYLGQLADMAAQASQRKYDKSRQEAEQSYELWQESNKRQTEFREAANNAQTAGDANYYNNIANQYKKYSQIYKQQFEERDAIARKNFESNKSMQIAQTRINTIAGAAMVLSQLGYWGIPIAAGMVKLGQDMVKDIKSQQYQSPGSDSSSGAFGGLPSAVDNTSGVGGSSIGDTPRSDGQTNALNIYIEGAITEEMINDVVIPVIQDGIDKRDIILISGTGEDSAQLSEVKGLSNGS